MALELKIAFVNLGCRVNRVELDAIAQVLEDAGYKVVDEDEAEIIVINTCAVTGEAEAKTRKAIRHASTQPQVKAVFATGCVTTLFEDEVASLGDNIYVVPEKNLVANKVIEVFGEDDENGRDETHDLGALTPTGRTRPGIKIQDGCDNRCTYCIVWKARGAARSLAWDKVLGQVQDLEAQGAQEIVLTGINLANYNYDDEQGKHWDLAALLELLLRETSVKRFRLGSIEPPETTEELLQVIGQSKGRIAPFLHLALQSGCEKTLGEMGRKYSAAQYGQIVARARELIENLAIGCDVIVGFPGETDQDFLESLEFCEKMGFEKMHVFRYSERPGTPAAARKDQVDPKVKQARARRMRKLASTMRKNAAENLCGTTQEVLIQNKGLGVTGGLFNCIVDTDLTPNTYAHVKIVGHKGDTVIGE